MTIGVSHRAPAPCPAAWIHSNAGWKQLASQVLAVLQDPPARKLDAKVLCAYSGTYELTADIKGTMRCENDELVFERSARPADGSR
jgi:hypothetical protein